MKIASLLQYNPLNGKAPTLFGIVIALSNMYDEKVATVLWNDGIIAHWRYEHFADAGEECRIEVCQ